MLIYGLAAFLIVHGILLRKLIAVLLSLAVIVIYGSALFVGILPINPFVSWEGHLCGAAGGVAAALILKKFE